MTEALLSSLPTICQKAWQTWHCLLPPTHSQNMTEALPELGYKAAGLGSLLINIWWILNHSSVSGVYSYYTTLCLMKNKSCTDVIKLVLSFVQMSLALIPTAVT